jgi:SAM-dependent methyltransferase
VLAEDIVAERAVGIMTPSLLDTQRAFDGVAAEYHHANTTNRLLCAMRARVHQTIVSQVPAGSRLLDLGCGPGGDAVALGLQGYRVTAIDWSPAMVAEARRRVASADADDCVEVQQVGIHELDRLEPAAARFDAAYSNFGPLNCVDDIAAAAPAIANRLTPGGVLIASVIGRVCPWEMALYASRGDLARALLRFRRGSVAVPLEGETVWTRYFNPAEFTAIFAAAGLQPVALRALGLFVPPPYMQAFADRHPQLIQSLQRIEDRCGALPLFRQCGDHFLIVMRKA